MATKFITLNKEYIPLPEEFVITMNDRGYNIERSDLRFIKYDKPMFLPNKIVNNGIDFYINYFPNYVSRKTRDSRPLHNVLYFEQYCYAHNINFITLYEKDIVDLGVEHVVDCIIEKMKQISHSKYPENYKISYSLSNKESKICILNDDKYVGFVEYNLSNEIVNYHKWSCSIDPEFWIDDMHNTFFPTVSKYKIRIQPYDYKPIREIYNTNVGLSRAVTNKTIDDKRKIFRSMGIKVIRKVAKNGEERKSVKDKFHWEPNVKKIPSRKLLEKNKIKSYPQLVKKLVDISEEKLNSSAHSHEFDLFHCDKGHKYWAVIREQIDMGCPVCNGDTVISGVNDIVTTHPQYARDWDYENNFPYLPEDVTQGSMREFWWICPKTGGSYICNLNRKMKGAGSPFIKNIKILDGYNDFETLYPNLIPIFSSKNNIRLKDISRMDVSKQFYWECSYCGHQWVRSLSYMITVNGCTYCMGVTKSKSIDEIKIYKYVNSITEQDVYSGDRTLLGNRELDIYIPGMNIAIEYNGVHWHDINILKGNTMYHYDKWNRCKKNNVELYSIWEDMWKNKPELVKTFVHNILYPKNSVNFSHCDLRKVEYCDIENFINENTLYHRTRGNNLYVGVFNKKEKLVDVIGVDNVCEYNILYFYNHARRNVNKNNENIVKNFVNSIYDGDVCLYVENALDKSLDKEYLKKSINVMYFNDIKYIDDLKENIKVTNTIHSYGYHLYRI